MPREHPGPWGSKLWDHLEEIRALRRARKRWLDIANHLEQQHGIKITQRAVRNFFARATARIKAGTLPLGFEEALGVVPKQPATVPAGPAEPASLPSPPPVKPESFEAEYDRRLKEHQAKKPGLKIMRGDD